VNDDEFGTAAFVTVTFSVFAGVPVHVPFVNRWYVTVPPALLEAPVRVAVSWTVAPRATEPPLGGMALPSDSLMIEVLMLGVNTIAEVERARSWEPVLAPSSLLRDMWYGEPVIELAEFPAPHSPSLAM